MIKTKTCGEKPKGCERELALVLFNRRDNAPDGRNKYCKACESRYNKQRMKENLGVTIIGRKAWNSWIRRKKKGNDPATTR